MTDPSCLKLQTPRSEILVSAFLRLRDDQVCRERLWRTWLPAETWAAALTMSGLIDGTVFTVDAAKFNMALSRCRRHLGPSMDRFDGTNQSGVFRIKYIRSFYYMLTDPYCQAEYPSPLDKKWKDSVDSVATDVLRQLVALSGGVVTRSTSSTTALSAMMLQHFNFNEYLPPLNSPMTTTQPAALSSTSTSDSCDQLEEAKEDAHEEKLRDVGDALLPILRLRSATTVQQQNETVQDPQEERLRDDDIQPAIERQDNESNASMLSCYWISRDALNLFAGGGSTSYEEFLAANVGSGNTVLDILDAHIAVLQAVGKTMNGWREVVEGRDADDLCSEYDIFGLKSRAMILCAAYQTAMLHMNTWTWKQCCSEACRQLNGLGVAQATKPRSVQDWNLEFRKRRIFLHPNIMVRCGKRPLPLLLVKYPAAKDRLAAFGLGNLSTLTVELMHGFCNEVLFPQLYQQWCRENSEAYSIDEDQLPTQDIFLKEHSIQNFSISTCWRWMKLIGFTYCTQRKSYYVDGHERDDVVASRKEFCRKYLTEIEPRCLRWVQYRSDELKAANLDPDFGYMYFDEDFNILYEFHIDYCCRENKSTTANAMHGKVASMSVRAPPGARPCEAIGQDESLFSQYQFPSKSWVGPNLERALLPKSPGEVLMLSAFLSRDLGFGMQMTDEQLALVNASRQGTHYIDRAAALEVHKYTQKQPLIRSPFVQDLLIGATKGGYWNGSHMAMQLEDVVDVLRVLRPEFDLVFFFDHSQGHARKQDGALDAQTMSRSFGGKQPKMHSSEIKGDCLGPFGSMLRVGDLQSMVFNADDEGPWWLSSEARERRKYDTPGNGTPKRKQRTRAELASALLEELGIVVEPNRPLKDLKQLATIHGVSLTHEKVHVNEGWCGKAKGLLQVLWERGWIDPSKCKEHKDREGCKVMNTSYYTLSGRKDLETGMMIESSSLKGLLGNCSDFKTEQTALEFLGSQLGVQVMLTPKFHCEFAGEGIEYAWAQAKGVMRRTPIREKRGRGNFIPLVNKCVCPETVLTKERIRRFSARARAYICTYYYLERETVGGVNDVGFTPAAQQQLLYKKIEQLMKRFKGHRCVLDFDKGFVLAGLKGADDDDAAAAA